MVQGLYPWASKPNAGDPHSVSVPNRKSKLNNPKLDQFGSHASTIVILLNEVQWLEDGWETGVG
jgi:hypothetical protein